LAEGKPKKKLSLDRGIFVAKKERQDGTTKAAWGKGGRRKKREAGQRNQAAPYLELGTRPVCGTSTVLMIKVNCNSLHLTSSVENRKNWETPRSKKGERSALGMEILEGAFFALVEASARRKAYGQTFS